MKKECAENSTVEGVLRAATFLIKTYKKVWIKRNGKVRKKPKKS